MTGQQPSGQAIAWPVWGHRQAVQTLAQAASTQRVRHAYLFSGIESVGKTTLAIAFAQALCCTDPPAAGVPCGQCLACRKIARGVHPDVQTFGIESQSATGSKSGGKNTTLTIETVRTLSATAVLRPVEARWRVIIVDDAELLQETAQEALLKTLEEPPPFAVLVLLSNDAELLLPTVRSRCQIVELATLPRATIQRGLEASGVPSDQASILAGASGGAPGWAIRAAAQPKLLSERIEAIDRALAWLAGTPYDRVVTGVRLGDSFTKRRPAVFRDLEIVLGLWRDALLLKAGTPEAVTFPARSEDLASHLAGWSLHSVHQAVRSVRQCIADLEANVRPRLAIESMVLQWPTR